MDLTGRDFLTLKDYTPDEIEFLINLAGELKEKKKNGVVEQPLIGKNVALIFEKTSTRTRCSFEVAAHDLGMGTTYLDPKGSQIGKKESIADTARVLAGMYDGIEYRGFGQDIVEELAKYAGVPVWIVVRTDEYHIDYKILHRLRTALVRIHAEKQTVVQTIKFLNAGIQKKNEIVNSKRAIAYIKAVQYKLLQPNRFGIGQNPIVNMAFDADNDFNGFNWEDLKGMVEKLADRYTKSDFKKLFTKVDFKFIGEKIPEALKNGMFNDQQICEMTKLLELAQEGNKVKFLNYIEKNWVKLSEKVFVGASSTIIAEYLLALILRTA